MLIYVITDRRARPDLGAERLVDEVVGSGADMVQIREKVLPAVEQLSLCRRAVVVGGPAVFVNARADIALAAGASGVHLPADGIPPRAIRLRWGRRIRIGVSTHSLDEAVRAGGSGADFVVFGPVYETESKRPWGPPVGLERLAEAAERAGVPVLAIGGVRPDRVGALKAAGAAGVAVIGAVVGAPDMAAAVRRLREEGER